MAFPIIYKEWKIDSFLSYIYFKGEKKEKKYIF